jgi:hypothetical protein
VESSGWLVAGDAFPNFEFWIWNLGFMESGKRKVESGKNQGAWAFPSWLRTKGLTERGGDGSVRGRRWRGGQAEA